MCVDGTVKQVLIERGPQRWPLKFRGVNDGEFLLKIADNIEELLTVFVGFYVTDAVDLFQFLR